MGYYTVIAGSIRYPGKPELDAALKFLVDGGWLAEDHKTFLDELGRPRYCGEDIVEESTHTLTFPQDSYRNLGGHLADLVKPAADYWLRLKNEDDDVGVMSPDSTWSLRAQDYARKHGLPVMAWPDCDDDFQDYADWAADIEDHFFSQDDPCV
jgi:hypothetical protein